MYAGDVDSLAGERGRDEGDVSRGCELVEGEISRPRGGLQ